MTNSSTAALVALLSFMSLATPVASGPYEDATAAYKRGEYETALLLLRPLADQGNAAAQSSLGSMYADGHGVLQDYSEAIKWYRKAADKGDSSAQANLGLMYYKGQGVPQDYAEALKLARPAADRGNARAQYVLGLMYKHGDGVAKDYLQAHVWLNLAAAGFMASETAMRNGAVSDRDSVANNMTPAQIAEAQKLAREWKPMNAR